MPILSQQSFHLLPRSAFSRAAASVSTLLLLVALGCKGDGTGVGLPPRITIEPAEPVAMFIGDTMSVRATIRNTPYTAVTYSSTSPDIASVDAETGLVTAHAAGVAVVAGVSRIDPRIFAEVEFTVVPDQPASLSFSAIRSAGGAEIDPASVDGSVEATLEVEAGNARRLEVRLREAVVCEEEFAPSIVGPPAASTVICIFDTAEFEVASATPHFMNGEATLQASLVASGERALASTAEIPLTLANASRLAATVEGERKAVDSAGDGWISGDVTVSVLPVLYEGGSAIESVALTYLAPGGGDTTATAEVFPFTFTLPHEGVLSGVTDPAFRLTLTSVGEEGAEGPEAVTEPLRYDGAPPRPGLFLPRAWIGAETRFVETYSVEGEADAGVGRVHLRFHAGDPAQPAGTIVADGAPVVTGSDLPQAGSGAYRLVAQVCDGLENCTLLDGYEFGVDLTPPIVESVSIPDRTANPASDLSIGVRDDLSGFPDALLEATVRLLDASPATPSCGPRVESIDLPGKPLAGGCAPDTLANPVPVPRTTAGYYHYTVVASDRAGNRSNAVERSLLVDLEPPSIGTIDMDVPLSPGEEMAVEAEADDDVELIDIAWRLVYPSEQGDLSIAIPFAPGVSLGTPFDDELTTAATASGSFPFVRTLTLGGSNGGARPTLLVDSLRATVRDGAGLTASAGMPIVPADYGNDVTTSEPFPRYSTADVSIDRTSVCTGGCTDEDPTWMRISARIEGESGTGRPFARIHFYRRDGGGLLTHVGSLAGTEATITNVGGRSSYTYTFDYEPEGRLAGDYGIVAVGVNSRGNALATELVAAPTVSFYLR